MRDNADGIAIKLLAAYGEIELAAKNGAVLVDRRGRQLLLGEIRKKSLHVICLDIAGPPVPEPLPYLGKVIVEAASGLFAVPLPPIVQEFPKHNPVELASRKMTALSDLGHFALSVQSARLSWLYRGPPLLLPG